MEESPLADVISFLRRHIVLLGVILFGLIILTTGIVMLPRAKEDSIVFEPSPKEESLPLTDTPTQVTVDVAGAVIKPGVYTLPPDARLKDAITAAGGIREDANHEAIAKSINLSQKLSDSSKIYIPYAGESVAAGASSNAVLGANSSALVNINSASSSDLEKLPKIGAVTAQKIVDGRPYSSTQDLLAKKVVSASVFKAIEALITAQ